VWPRRCRACNEFQSRTSGFPAHREPRTDITATAATPIIAALATVRLPAARMLEVLMSLGLRVDDVQQVCSTLHFQAGAVV
jgi:hypothetical protein